MPIEGIVKTGLRSVWIPRGASGQAERVSVFASFFVYNVSIAFTGVNQIFTITKSIMNDADFELCAITDNHASAWLLQITDQSSSITWTDGLTPVANIAGTAQRPFILPDTIIARKGGNITIVAQNGLVAVNTGVLSLIGARLYPLAQMS